MPLPTLVLGSFNLTDALGVQQPGAAVMAQGTSRGNPVPIEVAVKSWLQDGSIVITQGYDNREVSVRVQLGGNDLTATAALEAALHAEIGRPNTLTWTPTEGPAAVFDVITSSMTQDDTFDSADLIEMDHKLRYFQLRLVCSAFARSAAEVTSTALPATGSTTTTLDAMGATAGWTGTVDGVSATVVNTAGPPSTNSVSASVNAGIHTVTLAKTFAATTTTTKLLMVDRKAGRGSLTATGDGVSLPLVAQTASPTPGYVRSYFYVAASSLAATVFTLTDTSRDVQPVTLALTLDNVAVSNAWPTIGTARQQLRTLEVAGSAPAPGSLAVESSTTALGECLVYVYPDSELTAGYSPPLRQFRVSGGTVTSNSALVSGASEDLLNLTQFRVPIGFVPAGMYLLLGRLAKSSGTTATIDYSASTLINTVPTNVMTGARTLTTLTTAYKTHTLGRMILPTVDVSPNAHTAGVELVLSVVSNVSVTYDEMWLFNTSIGALIQVDCGTAAADARRLFIEPASVTTPRPTVRIGTNADRSDARYPVGKVGSWQQPQFTPPRVNVLAVTPNATDAVVSLRHYPRWFGNPAA